MPWLLIEFGVVYVIEGNQASSRRLWAQPILVLSPLVPLFYQDPNILSGQLDFLMGSSASSCGYKEFQAALWNAGSSAYSILPVSLSHSLCLCPSSGLCLHCFSLWGLYLCEVVCSGMVTLYLIGLHSKRVTKSTLKWNTCVTFAATSIFPSSIISTDWVSCIAAL